LSEPNPRFLADVMLGRLARWLRALGYDTLYEQSLDDTALAELARRENRILLTRDVELTRRRKLRAFLIHDDKVLRQLRQVVSAFDLKNTAAFTRCIECNTELASMERRDAAPLVPPYVFETQLLFRRCPRCGKVYWRGTHWMQMQNVVHGLENNDEE
jgi:uncharacterized protein with PIN domain